MKTLNVHNFLNRLFLLKRDIPFKNFMHVALPRVLSFVNKSTTCFVALMRDLK